MNRTDKLGKYFTGQYPSPQSKTSILVHITRPVDVEPKILQAKRSANVQIASVRDATERTPLNRKEAAPKPETRYRLWMCMSLVLLIAVTSVVGVDYRARHGRVYLTLVATNEYLVGVRKFGEWCNIPSSELKKLKGQDATVRLLSALLMETVSYFLPAEDEKQQSKTKNNRREHTSDDSGSEDYKRHSRILDSKLQTVFLRHDDSGIKQHLVSDAKLHAADSNTNND